jgi:UDP-hydrolysing UDP-N-acetyl-D-glucosamine 2-epimerase
MLNRSINEKLPRKVCAVLIDRANYGRMKPVLRAIAAHPKLQLQILASGTMVLARFQQPVQVVRKDGFPVDGEIYMELEGSTPSTMAKSIGLGVMEFANEFERCQPDVVLIIGDRYEALAAVIAAAYTNKCIAHIQGGEVTGSIDESARHAISKFAHYHFPSTDRSAEYLIRMGEHAEHILSIGCPSADVVREIDKVLPSTVVNGTGSGAIINVDAPFLLAVFHPTTTEYGGERQQMQEVLNALAAIRMPAVLLWPNIDAGSDQISRAIRGFRDQVRPDWLRTITNLCPEDYVRVLANAACAIGNSSSFVRDASFLGTPIVLVGNRQTGREMDEHVTTVRLDCAEIERAVRDQLAHGRYSPSTLYGSGPVSQRIANALADLRLYVQKRLAFVDTPVGTNDLLLLSGQSASDN